MVQVVDCLSMTFEPHIFSLGKLEKGQQPSLLGVQVNDLVVYFKLLSPELVLPSFEYRKCGIDD